MSFDVAVLPMILSLAAGQGAPPAQAAKERITQTRVVKAGDWTATVTLSGREHRRIGFRPTEYTLTLKGPGDREPVCLVQPSSMNGVNVEVVLGEDGLLFLAPGLDDRPGTLFFPGSKKGVALELPPLTQRSPYEPYYSFGPVWFLGDILFFDRTPFPGHRQVGYFVLDIQKQQVRGSGVILEVANPEQGVARAAGVYGDSVFRAGRYLFWVNEGDDNSWYPDVVKGTWKPRKVRAFDLQAGKIIDAAAVPREALKPDAARLRRLAADPSGRIADELKQWAAAVSK